jgi:hypothetical protein
MKTSWLRFLSFVPFLLAGANCTVEPEAPPVLAPPTAHRSQALACPALQYAEGATPPSTKAQRVAGAVTPLAVAAGPELVLPCTTQTECSAIPNSRCASNDGGQKFFCRVDECFADADCEGGDVCQCPGDGGGLGSRCLPGNCRVDADCGAGGFCSPSHDDCGRFSGFDGYYCHTAQDECNSDADCGSEYGDLCIYEPQAGRWVCFQGEACVG